MADPYRRSVRSWMLYDWANSAFATTILAAVFPIYYAAVAGSTLRSGAQATQYYALTLSISVLIVAVLSPLLGAAADANGTRKRWLLVFAALGMVATTALYTVGAGDWVAASIIFGLARIGFGGSIVFYDALLPHVAREEDADRVSAWAYALGYLGGGLLLMANIALIFALPDDELGVRISLVSVGVWWAVFTIPLIRHVPEPPPVAGGRPAGRSALGSALSELTRTARELRRLPDLLRFLLAFLIYNDAINVVISVAAIYGTELRFESTELILAVLLVQFVGIPYSLAFGRMVGTRSVTVRGRFVIAFVAASIVAMPVVGIGLRLLAPTDMTGAALPDHPDQGRVELAATEGPVEFAWNGASLQVVHDAGPDFAELDVLVDGRPVLVDGEPLVLGARTDVERRGERLEIPVAEPGPHRLELVPTPETSSGRVSLTSVEVLAPDRQSNLGVILGAIVVMQLVVAVVALAASRVRRLPDVLAAKQAILLALSAYTIIACWGFALDSIAEFWCLAWMLAICQGGSQALSRSLYARLIPAQRSGEYFGFFSVLSKFASFLSPLVFVASVWLFDSSRPAVGFLAVFFLTGMWLLRGVDVERGHRLVLAGSGPTN